MAHSCEKKRKREKTCVSRIFNVFSCFLCLCFVFFCLLFFSFFFEFCFWNKATHTKFFKIKFSLGLELEFHLRNTKVLGASGATKLQFWTFPSSPFGQVLASPLLSGFRGQLCPPFWVSQINPKSPGHPSSSHPKPRPLVWGLLVARVCEALWYRVMKEVGKACSLSKDIESIVASRFKQVGSVSSCLGSGTLCLSAAHSGRNTFRIVVEHGQLHADDRWRGDVTHSGSPLEGGRQIWVHWETPYSGYWRSNSSRKGCGIRSWTVSADLVGDFLRSQCTLAT